MKIAVCSGGYDPLHSGHLASFQAARMLADKLYVAVNSDDWLSRKKGKPFMPLGERVAVTSALDTPDALLLFDDSDDTAKDAIRQLRKNYPEATIVFANGGDRTSDNIPEMDIDDNNIEFVFGIGGEDKVNSSSWILDTWKAPKTEREWGYYRVLHEVEGTKVKELTVEPKQSLSMQKHAKRSEHWIVTEGKCKIRKYAETGELTETILSKHDTITIQPNEWHQLVNTSTKPCKIVEIQYGKKCVEEDIKRQNA